MDIIGSISGFKVKKGDHIIKGILYTVWDIREKNSKPSNLVIVSEWGASVTYNPDSVFLHKPYTLHLKPVFHPAIRYNRPAHE